MSAVSEHACRRGRRQRLLIVSSALLLLTVMPSDANALELVWRGDALLVRDCTRVDSGEEVSEGCKNSPLAHFSAAGVDANTGRRYEGDPVRLRREILRRRPSEVWLNSGGGNLLAGIQVGRVLREFGLDVTVRKGHRCVSACTVAFLGGHGRRVENGASYEPHSSSGYLTTELDPKLLSATKRAPRAALLEQAIDERRYAAEAEDGAAKLVDYIREMLTPPGLPFQSSRARIAQLMDAHLYSDIELSSYSRLHLDRDVALLSSGVGNAVLRDMLKRIEERAALDVAEVLERNVASLGPRARTALRILKLMFSSGIDRTAVPSAEQLMELGIINVE